MSDPIRCDVCNGEGVFWLCAIDCAAAASGDLCDNTDHLAHYSIVDCGPCNGTGERPGLLRRVENFIRSAFASL